MSRAARYGNVPPDVFEDMDWDWAMEVSRRVTLMHQEETKFVLEAHLEMTKGIIRASGHSIL